MYLDLGYDGRYGLVGCKNDQMTNDTQARFSPSTSVLPSSYLSTCASKGWYSMAIEGSSTNQGTQFHFTPNNIVGEYKMWCTHIENTPTNFVPVLCSEKITKMTELNYGPVS
jgi:hypothetical protein